MKKLIGLLFSVLTFTTCVFSQTPADGAMIFSRGCPSYNFPIVFVYQGGNFRTSDFQASVKTVASWGKIDETHFFVKTTASDSFACGLLPTDYATVWVNKKNPETYFNGVYYNAVKDSVYLLDYPNRNAIDFFNGDLTGGITISPIIFHDSGSQDVYPYFNFGASILCYNPIAPQPFTNVFVIADTMGEALSPKITWVCADKRIVPDSLDSLNNGRNFVVYNNGMTGFLVIVPDYENHYEFVSMNGRRFLVPWSLQDSANQYRNAVMASWSWDSSTAKKLTTAYLVRYPIVGNALIAPQMFLLENNNKIWESQSFGQLDQITDTSKITGYGTNWKNKLIEIPDAFLTNYTIPTVNVKTKPAAKTPLAAKVFSLRTMNVLGQTIGSSNRNSFGPRLVLQSNGMVVKEMNFNRQSR
jgi:hypothetical protein